MTHKFIKLFMAVLFAGFLVGCGSSGGGSSSGGDSVGDISGFGDNTGEISGEEFVFPEGIEINSSSIRGYKIAGRQTETDDLQAKFSKKLEQNLYTPNYNIIPGTYDVAVGSGATYVKVLIVVRNNNNVSTNVTFPARLIARSSTGKYQNGILLKKASVAVPANTLYRITLVMYCGNVNKHATYDGDAEWYDKLIVSDSATLKELTDLVANKKINVEEYTDAEEDDYDDITYKLQQIVWNITETTGAGLTQYRKDWIEALPDSL
ncbi:MAG: hypothetical protein LBS73_04665 [Campylobacteraceae bacterium]|jgi:hypothetical protein|nr:hypothetical protein [Campylobacteraceae bacterium]